MYKYANDKYLLIVGIRTLSSQRNTKPEALLTVNIFAYGEETLRDGT